MRSRSVVEYREIDRLRADYAEAEKTRAQVAARLKEVENAHKLATGRAKEAQEALATAEKKLWATP